MNIIEIPFHGETIPLIIKPDGSRYIQMKPVCEALGLAWQSQLAKVKQDPHLKVNDIVIRSGDSVQPVTVIPANRFVAWLYTVNPWKVWNPGTRRKLELFREEAADVLDAHFTGQPMQSRGHMPPLPERTAKRALRPEAQKAVRYYRMGLRTAEIATLLGHTKSNVRTFLQVAEQLGLIVPDQKRLKGRGHIRHIPSRAHLTLVEG